jgi:hypothetical protein
LIKIPRFAPPEGKQKALHPPGLAAFEHDQWAKKYLRAILRCKKSNKTKAKFEKQSIQISKEFFSGSMNPKTVMSKRPQQFSCGISTPVFSKISLSGLVFDGVTALFCFLLRLLFVQKPPRTQALLLPDADSAVGFDMNGCLDWSTS